jgi:hypothetical protein
MKPPEHRLRANAVIVVGAVAFDLAIDALRHWGPEPWWQHAVTIVIVALAFTWANGGFAKPSKPDV